MDNKTKILITQSNYIPWKGYFDSISKVDHFVIYDDMQYTKRDWRNRNVIKTESGLKWLSIPVEVKGKYFQKINETKISDKNWIDSHLGIIRANYKRAKSFNDTFPWIEDVYKNCKFDRLTDVNEYIIKEILKYLNITTSIARSEEFTLADDRTDRLVDICKELKGDIYYTGPAAKNYLEEQRFVDNNIKVEYLNYSGYKEYPQLYGEFVHNVSIIDLLLNVGEDSIYYLTQ